MIGCAVGTTGIFFLLSRLATAHPITDDPGPGSLNQMRFAFAGLVFAGGQLGGLLAVNVRVALAARGSEGAEPGLTATDE